MDKVSLFGLKTAVKILKFCLAFMSILKPRNPNWQTSRCISSWLLNRLPSCQLDMVCYGHVMKEAWRLPCAAVFLLTLPWLLGTPHCSYLQLTIIISQMSFKNVTCSSKNCNSVIVKGNFGTNPAMLHRADTF